MYLKVDQNRPIWYSVSKESQSEAQIDIHKGKKRYRELAWSSNELRGIQASR